MAPQDSIHSMRRIVVFGVIMGLVGLYSLQLVRMQIFEHAEYEMKSAENSMKPVEDIPLRGVFWDRNLKLLVENTPTYTVRIIPAEYDDENDSLLEAILGFPNGTVQNILGKNSQYSPYVPVKLKRGVDFEVIGWLEENAERLPGVNYIVEMQRGYKDSIMASHMYGYTKEISPKLLEADKYYNPGDLVGYTGIEKKYEPVLRGIKGFKYMMVDSKGREVLSLKDKGRRIPAIKGRDVVLGIDADAQKAAEAGLKGFVGAAVAIEPETGEILAMASAPNYDLNEFSYFTPKEFIKGLYTDPQKPLFNRATMAAHPPGSTFKVLSAIAALESGAINENSTLNCVGGYVYGGRLFKCHAHHGGINVVHGIEQSCNGFFYQLIFKVGLDNLASYAAKFNLGRKTGVDIGEESNGLIPTEKYYENIYGKNWPRGIMVSLGIGQGEIGVTPLQLANYVSLIANNGKSFVPHIVKGYLDENKKFVPLAFEPVNTGISQKTFDIVKKGMFLVVNGSGTGTAIKSKDYEIAGKTGTAQNPHGKDHAWFMAFAPFDHPKIAVAVMVENVGFGATYAAPIARRIMDAYLLKLMKKTPSEKVEFTVGEAVD